MLQLRADREGGSVGYEHRRPERARLYQFVEQYHPAFEAPWMAKSATLLAEVAAKDRGD